MWQAIKLLYKFNWRYKYAFVGGMLFLIVGRVLANFSVFFFKFIVEEIQAGNISTLINLLFAVVVVRLITTIFEITADYINDKYIINGARDIQEAVFSHLHRLDYIFHTNRRSGGLISAMKRGNSAAFSFNIELNRNIPRLVIDFIFLLTTFYFLNIKMMVVLAGFVVFFLVIARYLVRLNVTRRREVNDQEDIVSGIVVDNMINYETVKFFAREDWEEQRLHETNNKYLKAVWGYANSFRLIDFTEGIVSTLGIVIISLIAIQDTLSGNMSLSEFVLVFTFVSNFFPKFADLVYKFRELAKNETDLDKYLNLLNVPFEVVESENAIKVNNAKGEIEFKNVCFNYKGRSKVINDLNLKIKSGESVAFVGESGAGKTTITRLLLRFFDPESGEIMLDGINLKSLTKQSLRRSIGVVPQEPVLFNDSVAYNIAYGSDDKSINHIIHAAKVANLHHFIERLPEGYDTLVGERGIKLSGGQKQRLAIARMVLADPPVIIFDEATSQLDSRSERLIQEALWEIATGRTTIIIAHRLSTVMKANRIIVMKQGEMIESGSHSELIAVKGEYYRMWTIQQGKDK